MKKRLKSDFDILPLNNPVDLFSDHTFHVSKKLVENSTTEEFGAKNRFSSSRNCTLRFVIKIAVN